MKPLTLADLPAAIQSHITQALKGVRQQIVETGEADAAILVYGDETAIVDGNAENEREKDLLAFMVRELVALHNAHTVVHISEVWTLPEGMPKEQQAALYARYGAISHMPERIEQVMVNIECRDGAHWLARADIRRKGRAVTIGEPAINDLPRGGAAGRYAGWFTP